MSRADDMAAKLDERHRSLYEVADFVEAIPDEQFNLEHWWLPDGMAFDDCKNEIYKVADGPCGCAVGHMVKNALFGLHANLLDETNRDRIFVVLADTFGINCQLAHFLFDNYSYRQDQRDKQHVAARLRFIADEQIHDRIIMRHEALAT